MDEEIKSGVSTASMLKVADSDYCKCRKKSNMMTSLAVIKYISIIIDKTT